MTNRFVEVLTLLIMLICCINMRAQDSLNLSIRNEALQSFAEKNYVKALPLYRELLKAFPKEPEYQYGMGVCLVGLNQDIEEAIQLLHSVSMVNYDPMAWFYLGRAYHLNYSFEEAIRAYSKYLLMGKSVDIASYHVERQIEMAKNGIEFTSGGRSVHVISTEIIQAEQLPMAAAINGTGKLIRKPLEFCSKSDLRENYRPWMFLPVYTDINAYIYMSGLEKRRKHEKQLFRIRNLNHELWGIPELLDFRINSAYDEEYPFFDTRSSTLYFSSKGHSSMGGYDIFKSVYDWNAKTWSKPENLGFPINSPHDDFLFITDELSRTASFVSTRNTGPGQLGVYRIRLEKDTTGARFTNMDEILKISQLLVEPEKQATDSEANDKPDSASGLPMAAQAVIPFEEPLRTSENYHKVLADALILQLRADSLARITRDKRILAKDTPDEEMKKQLMAEIILSDKEAKYSQREADKRFSEARNLKPLPIVYTNQADTLIELTKEINGIKVYQYRNTTPAEVHKETLIRPSVPVTPLSGSEKKAVAVTDEFALLEESPYNDSSPIPRGLGTHSGLVYRIQLGVFSKIRPNDAFDGISPVAYEQVNGSNVFKYYAGLFGSLNAVTRALEQIRLKGFQDAFIVAFLDGKLISTEKAREIEFEGFKL